MPKVSAGVIDFAVYENSKEYLGLASIDFPEITNKVITVSGAGIAGDIDIPIRSRMEPMHMTINFHDNQVSADRLAQNIVHNLDCRVVHDVFDSATGNYATNRYKYVFRCIPITQSEGNVAPASPQNASVEMSVLSLKKYVNGEKVLHIDPISWHRDYKTTNRIASIKKALGK